MFNRAKYYNELYSVDVSILPQDSDILDVPSPVDVEENGQDKLLRHLYNDRGGRLCLRVLVSPWISKMAGRLLNTGFSARFVGDFVEKNRIDLSICEKQKFSSWNDFFTRRLRQGERPVDEREKVLVSPCDGKLSVHNRKFLCSAA